MHTEASVLVRYVDGEMSRADVDLLTRHLDVCATCEAQLADLQATRSAFRSLIGELDAAERNWDDVALPTVTVLPIPGRTKVHIPWRWAAGILLCSGAAAAAVGVRALVEVEEPRTTPAELVEPAVQPAPRVTGGVLVAPLRGEVTVELSDAVPGTRITVIPSDRADVAVQTYDTAQIRFVARSGHVMVRLDGMAAQLGLAVPTRFVKVHVVANGQAVAVIENGMTQVLRRSAVTIEGSPQ